MFFPYGIYVFSAENFKIKNHPTASTLDPITRSIFSSDKYTFTLLYEKKS